MKKRILNYMKSIDGLLADPPADVDWDYEIKKHLIQLDFFKHERFVHLIVMVLFAIMTFFTILSAINNPTLGLLMIFMSLMILLVPYIMHYYLLENSVQYMYTQYDEMLDRSEKQKGLK